MTKILLIKSSPRGTASYSNQVADNLIENLRHVHPGASVSIRDLGREPPPHIDMDFASGLATTAEQRSANQRTAVDRSDTLVEELLDADIVVIAAAMINFAIPSTLKAWVDHVTRSGKTFSYGQGGPKGLVGGKRVILVLAKGGVYSGSAQSIDFVTPYMKHMLAFLGMSDVQVIEVEGTNLGAQSAEAALARGVKCADAVASQLAV